MKINIPLDLLPTTGTEVTLSLVSITPHLAQAYLRTQQRNRRLRSRHVNILARDMAAGEWTLTTAGIVFDDQGRLIDGQHRLHAIIGSNTTQTMFVWSGWPSATQDAMDCGAGRTVAEQLGLEGTQNTPKLISYVNSIAKVWCRYGYKVTLPQVRRILPLLPQLATAALADKPSLDVRSAKYLGMIGLALHIPGKAKEAAALWDAVTTGLRIDSEDHPAHRIRQAYFQEGSSTGGGAATAAGDYVADCIQCWLSGTRMKTAKPTGTGLDFMRKALPDTYSQMRRILGFQS